MDDIELYWEDVINMPTGTFIIRNEALEWLNIDKKRTYQN